MRLESKLVPTLSFQRAALLLWCHTLLSSLSPTYSDLGIYICPFFSDKGKFSEFFPSVYVTRQFFKKLFAENERKQGKENEMGKSGEYVIHKLVTQQ